VSLAHLSSSAVDHGGRRARQLDPPPVQQLVKLNVLLVDDDPADTSLILSLLASHPNVAAVRAVDSPVLALRQFLVGYRRPDLVLLDVHMPRIDGFELLKGLRLIPRMSSVPVVFLTTSGLEKDVLAYRGSSASMYVVKPDTLGELQIRMDGILERAISGVWNQ
jgi:DNA-binding response OmpR family regulator